jgi:outer membrane receptor for ferrienterochelin and colicins
MRRGLVAALVLAVLPNVQYPPWPRAAHAEPSPETLPEVVVTGTKTEESQWDATVPTQVISQERIEETATLDVENVFREIPGLYVRRNEQFALGASTIRMQGADPNKVAILRDGRRFRGGIDGVVDLRDIAANNIERIEILRGPASSLYGSDAMAGVVNIITRSGSPTPTVETTAAAGSFDRRFASVSHGWRLGPVRYFVSGLHDEFQIFEQFGTVSAQFGDGNEDEKQRRDQASLRLDVDLGKGHALMLTPSYLQQTNPESTNRDLVTGAEWRWRPRPTSALTTWVNRYEFGRDNDLAGFEEDRNFVDWEAESRWTGELGASRLWESAQLTVGTRGRRQALDQSALKITGPSGLVEQPAVDASIWQISPFLQTDLLLAERWSFLVGSSFDVNERYGFDANPRGTLTWRPTDWLRLSASGGRGYRAPDLLQLFGIDVNAGGLYALLGNPDLEPETDLAVNLEAQVQARGLSGFVTFFRHDFKDLIAFAQVPVCTAPGSPPGCIVDPLPGLPGSLRFQTQNFAEATTLGVEASLEVAPLEPFNRGLGSPHAVSMGIGYAFLDTVNRNGIPGEDGNELPFRPRHRVLPQVTYRHRDLGLVASLWAEYESDAFTDIANTPELRSRAHWLLNFKVSIAPARWLPPGTGPAGRVLAAVRHLHCFVQGENVLDAEFGPVSATGRLASPAAYTGGLGMRF